MANANEERRVDLSSQMEVRAAAGGARQLYGYAAVFDRLSEEFPGNWREILVHGCFDDVLTQDVRCLVNHDSGELIGRTTSKTCRIGVDRIGLWFEVDLPNTTGAGELVELIQRGDITGCSFTFTTAEGGAHWERQGTYDLRTVTRVSRLYDVGPVTFPAYPDTEVAARSRELWAAPHEPTEPPALVIRRELGAEALRFGFRL